MIDVAALTEAAATLDAYAEELQLSSTRQGVAGPDWSLEPDAKLAFDCDRMLAARLRAVAALLSCFHPANQAGEPVVELDMPTPLELLQQIRHQDYLSDTARHRIDRVLDLAAVMQPVPTIEDPASRRPE
ncbi:MULTISPECIES: hypothetical protein [Achromobacter]|uniref:hypothetical protein n=1 Tax=Achromobacter TaxID=222 RepID=UPI0023F9B82E|nr:hypothetical protein [Achromobacter anxifer]MDF8363372.1 hypothetical protein [Achromobacter anxifer]